jgi:REP element-mobilizing transposase RayT
MGLNNVIYRNHTYFLTLTVVRWIDVFTRPIYKRKMVKSINFCIDNKGLSVHAWCLMTNHLHMIASAKEDFHLSDILRDMKKHTSKEMVNLVREPGESRQEWMLDQFEFLGRVDPKIKYNKFWQEGNEPIDLFTAEVFMQKMNYIHYNPVVAEIVEEPEHYLYSSARDYAGLKGLVKLDMV